MNYYKNNNKRYKWRDHEDRTLFNIIEKYLSDIKEKEIYQNIFDMLLAEIGLEYKEGKYIETKVKGIQGTKNFRYVSSDYIETLNNIIEIEISKIKEKEQNIFYETQGKNNLEKLENVQGFEKIKNKIKKIRNWEKEYRYTFVNSDSEYTLEITNDIYVLFNQSHSKDVETCQSPLSKDEENKKGLVGFCVNGTNRAITVLDKNRNVVTNRVIRLKILKNEKGEIEPVIFVEESDQLGKKGLSEIYGLLEILSHKTGLPVVIAKVRSESLENIKKVAEWEEMKYKILFFKGRSSYDYIDWYGEDCEGWIEYGLYRQEKEMFISKNFRELSIYPIKEVPDDKKQKKIKQIEQENGLIRVDTGKDPPINNKINKQEIEITEK